MKVRFHDIVWDTDGEQVDLPTEVTLEVEPDTVLPEEAADTLSDKFGWCVQSVDYTILKD